MLDHIFPNFPFSKNLPIFVVLIFSKASRFQRSLLFFSPRLNIFLIPSWAKSPGWKISERFLFWESNHGQQWLSRTCQIKICQSFCWRQNFDRFSRDKIRPFWWKLRPFPFSKYHKTSFLRKILTLYWFSSVFKNFYFVFVYIFSKLVFQGYYLQQNFPKKVHQES